jgi:hypothetical protein
VHLVSLHEPLNCSALRLLSVSLVQGINSTSFLTLFDKSIEYLRVISPLKTSFKRYFVCFPDLFGFGDQGWREPDIMWD